MNLENSNMEFRSDCIAFPAVYTYYLHFTNPVNLSAYSKLIVEDARSGAFVTNSNHIRMQRLCVGSSVKPTTVKSVPTSINGKSLVFDISSLQGSQYIRLGLYRRIRRADNPHPFRVTTLLIYYGAAPSRGRKDKL